MAHTADTLAREALHAHQLHKGKIALHTKTPINTIQDLSLAYTPGVAAVSKVVADNKDLVWEYTARGNWVAVVSDGSAVLGLGNIGPQAALPVMEGKAVLFKEFADVDAFPIVLDTQDPDEIIRIVTALAPGFGGINLEDISAPRCFYIEKKLQEQLSIPVMHDDQHGTAIVVLAGLLNALTIVQKKISDVVIAINGAGAAGTAIANILASQNAKDIILADSRGIISRHRTDLNPEKQALLHYTNATNRSGGIADLLQHADVFIGVSKGNLVNGSMIQTMADNPIVFALANPDPEILPDEAYAAGAVVVATGRSDLPNQVNNVLAFPGVFRGAFDARAHAITEEMKIAAAHAIAASIPHPSKEHILPSPLDKTVAQAVAKAVASVAPKDRS